MCLQETSGLHQVLSQNDRRDGLGKASSFSSTHKPTLGYSYHLWFSQEYPQALNTTPKETTSIHHLLWRKSFKRWICSMNEFSPSFKQANCLSTTQPSPKHHDIWVVSHQPARKYPSKGENDWKWSRWASSKAFPSHHGIVEEHQDELSNEGASNVQKRYFMCNLVNRGRIRNQLDRFHSPWPWSCSI